MMCLMIKGKRCAIPMNAPEVYCDANSGTEGDVSGAEAKELPRVCMANFKMLIHPFLKHWSTDHIREQFVTVHIKLPTLNLH